MRGQLCGFEGPARAPVSPNFGGHSEGETPLPIPNRAVKPLSADGTWPARAWESRSPPISLTSRPRAARRRVRPAWAAAWGCESPVEEMIPTQAEGNCVVVRRGGKEAGGVIRGLRDTNRIGGGAVWASQHGMAKPVVIKGPSRKCGRRAEKAVVLIRGDLHRCPGMPVHLVGARRVARDGAGRKAGARGGEVSRGRSTGGIAGRREGPNAKSSVRTLVLVTVAVIAANPCGGLVGRVGG